LENSRFLPPVKTAVIPNLNAIAAAFKCSARAVFSLEFGIAEKIIKTT
jgi:hypothetical protein